jgi:hypothetical protein
MKKIYLLTYYDPFERFAYSSFQKALEAFYDSFKICEMEPIDEETLMMIDYINKETGKTIKEYILTIPNEKVFNETFGETCDIISLEIL